ncbi:MAG: NAD(+)/NADH kinase [Acidimicrobiia bacterium]
MTTVGIVLHHQREEAARLAQHAARWLNERGHTVCLPKSDAEAGGLPDYACADDDLRSRADVVVSLGGDGTMLRAVELVATAGVPLLGVNVGLLGYLTEVEPPAMETALARYLSGDYSIEERMMLSIEVTAPSGNADGGPRRALNEAVIEKMMGGHTVRLRVSIDDTVFTTYAADGVIVATPTGSTAYSLSARGPIVSPRHRSIVLTPVSPHMLFDRALVLDPEELVTIEVIGHRPAALSIDGRAGGVLEEGDRIECRGAEQSARFVRFGRRDFHQILKAKFGLADR